MTTIDEGEVPVPPADGYRLKNVVMGLPLFPDYLLPPPDLAADPKVVDLAAARQQKAEEEGIYRPFKIEPMRVKWTLIWERQVAGENPDAVGAGRGR